MGRVSRPRQFVARLAGGKLREAKFKFNKEDKAQLLTVLASNKAARTFVRAVEEKAITMFKAYMELEEERPTPSATRATLKQLKQDTSSLRKGLEAMDSDTRFRVELCLQAQLSRSHDVTATSKQPSNKSTLAMIESARALRLAAQEFIDHLTQVLATLDSVITMARSGLRKIEPGRPEVRWRVEFATVVAWNYLESLKTEPTATPKTEVTEESPFESVLRICFKAAGVRLKDVHKLALAAIRQIKVQQSSKT